MSKNKTICVVITARPSYSRIKSVLLHLKKDKTIKLYILCSGSALLERYGKVVNLIKQDGFNVINKLPTVVEGDDPINMTMTTANTISSTSTALESLRPDFVITIADRYETIGTAISAAYLGIPLIHIQGGEVTGNIDEKVRHAVSKLSDIHFVATEKSLKRLISMGENPKTIHNAGCPSIDIARNALEIPFDDVRNAVKLHGAGVNLNLKEDYIVVLAHPETDSYAKSFERMQNLLKVIANLDLQSIILWPNVDAGSDSTSKAIRIARESKILENSIFIKNLEGDIFLKLLYSSKCLIGNSSVGIRESAFLGTPVVNIGDRQKGRESSNNVKHCKWSEDEISKSIKYQLTNGKYPSSNIYGDGLSGKRIAKIIQNLSPNVDFKVFYE